MFLAIYYQKIIDRESPKRGITELKYIDPRKIKKIREIRKKRPDNPLPSQLANNLSIIDEFVEKHAKEGDNSGNSRNGDYPKTLKTSHKFCKGR